MQEPSQWRTKTIARARGCRPIGSRIVDDVSWRISLVRRFDRWLGSLGRLRSDEQRADWRVELDENCQGDIRGWSIKVARRSSEKGLAGGGGG